MFSFISDFQYRLQKCSVTIRMNDAWCTSLQMSFSIRKEDGAWKQLISYRYTQIVWLEKLLLTVVFPKNRTLHDT